jgi:uncharacterized membrane protein
MFIINPLFWVIIGLGIAVPATFTIIVNISFKLRNGDNYEFSLVGLFKVYLIALIGWGIFFSEVVR